MKRVAKPVFFIVALILVLFACASFLGFNSKYGDIDRVYLKGLDDIEWGMDLGNGALAVFAPTDSENVTDQQLQESPTVRLCSTPRTRTLWSALRSIRARRRPMR